MLTLLKCLYFCQTRVALSARILYDNYTCFPYPLSNSPVQLLGTSQKYNTPLHQRGAALSQWNRNEQSKMWTHPFPQCFPRYLPHCKNYIGITSPEKHTPDCSWITAYHMHCPASHAPARRWRTAHGVSQSYENNEMCAFIGFRVRCHASVRLSRVHRDIPSAPSRRIAARLKTKTYTLIFTRAASTLTYKKGTNTYTLIFTRPWSTFTWWTRSNAVGIV